MPSSPNEPFNADQDERAFLHLEVSQSHTDHSQLVDDTSLEQTSVLPAAHAATSSLIRHRPGRSSGAGLNEFQSLLEAAQRLPDQPDHGHVNGSRDESSLSTPLIRRSARSSELARRFPLTRQYSGRPHIPGEDSGSDTEEPRTRRPYYRGPDALNGQSSSRMPPARTQNNPTVDNIEEDMPRYRGSHERQRHISSSADRQHATFSDILQDTRRMSDSQQPERGAGSYHSATSTNERHRRLESLLARQSLYDWGPELLTPRTDAGVGAERPRSNSIRRWRPPERLQDYASNHNRQAFNNSTFGPSRSVAALESDALESHSSPSATTREGHNEIASRVDRALREYSIARRALRSRNETLASSGSSITETLSARGLAPTSHREIDDTPHDAQERASWAAQPRYSDRLDTHPLTRPGTDDRQNDLLRRRFRDLGWTRRRDLINEALDQTNGVASGPLFDSASSAETRRELDRWRSRNMISKGRCTEARNRTSEMIKARSTLRYLASLRDPDMDTVKAWKLASELGLHNQSLQEGIKNLPLSIDDLPQPAYCSWLQPGMTWTGRQSADDQLEKKSPGQRMFEARDNVMRRAEAERDRVTAAANEHDFLRNALNQDTPPDPLERTLMTTREQAMIANDFIMLAQNSMQVLENAERELSTMLEQSERLLRENQDQLRENTRQLAQDAEQLRDHDIDIARLTTSHTSSSPRSILVAQPRDQWNVKVTLHEVDWDAMTVTGTMTASSGSSEESRSVSVSPPGTSMDSFFTGEIIDFTHHGLDTIGQNSHNTNVNTGSRQQPQVWRTGGPETDLIYWAGIGPFREEIQLRMLHRSQKVLGQSTETTPTSSFTSSYSQGDLPATNVTKDDVAQPNTETVSLTLTAEERAKIKLRTMHDLLTDPVWLGENLNEKGWILMRWKERCFVAPGLAPNPEPTRPWIPSADARDGFSSGPWSSFTDFRQHQAEARSRVYTTNAEERGEVSDGASGSRPGTWGLTISGFYYVALHRLSGRIEGLYYDCGSAPYQHLRMSAGDTPAQLFGEAGIDQPLHGGMRSNFNLVQFR